MTFPATLPLCRSSPTTPTALVSGIAGQDGALLAARLVSLGYRVVGTSRTPATCDRSSLEALGIAGDVRIEALDPTHAAAVTRLVESVAPDEIYHLAGESSIGRSFADPAGTFASTALGTLHLLEALRQTALRTRLFVAGSVAMFGDTGGAPADESTPCRPVDPYGLAKATAFALVAQYRSLHGVHACTGILANHESALRPERFVTQKVAAAACRIAAGDPAPLRLGDLSVERDWGWAEEYVVAMHAMLQRDEPEDFLIATGTTVSLGTFVAAAFERAGIDWRWHVVHDESLVRRGEPRSQRMAVTRAADRLGWKATITATEVAQRMVDARLAARRLERRAA